MSTVRLKDIAERVGVSVMTVSRVLRNSPDISEQTREKVLKAAWEMGYVPDATARGLRTGTSLLVGVALPTLSAHWVGQVLEPIETFVDESQRDLLIASSKGSSDVQEHAVDRLLSRRIEGIWLFPLRHVERPVNLYRRIERQGARLVYLGVSEESYPAPKVVFDINQQMELAVQHLLELGHRHIAYVSGPRDCLDNMQRQVAFERIVRERLGGESPLIIQGGASPDAGVQVVDELVSHYTQVTGLIAYNDAIGASIITELLNRNFRIPEQLSVVGWGNDPQAASGPIPLTTVSVPWRELGAKGAELMASLLSQSPQRGQQLQQPSIQDVILPGELIVRASTGKAPSR